MTVEHRGIPIRIPEGEVFIPVVINDNDELRTVNTTIAVEKSLWATGESKGDRARVREVYSAAICQTLIDLGVWNEKMDVQKLTRDLINMLSFASESTFTSHPDNNQEIAVRVTRQPDGTPQVATEIATLIP